MTNGNGYTTPGWFYRKPTLQLGLGISGKDKGSTTKSLTDYALYTQSGGTLDYAGWVNIGAPVPQGISATGETAAGVLSALGTGEGALPLERLSAPPFPKETLPEYYYWALNEFNEWAPVYNPSAAKQAWEQTWTGKQAALEEEARTREEQQKAEQQAWERKWLQDQALQEQQRWQEEQTATAQQQQAMLGWYREQAAMEQAQKEADIRAQLMTQPISWLDPRLYGQGQVPTVQAWMAPLSPSEYGLKIGEQVPGWTASGGSYMPSLRTPSAQYMARMGPTAQQQYYGYEQARTGKLPEETMFRMGYQPRKNLPQLRWLNK